MGFGPQLVDLDADGRRDLISGSWPGEIFFFKGQEDGTFAAPQMIADVEGVYINIGGGIREEPQGGLVITGNADFEKTDEGTFAVYHGKRIKSTPEKPVSITGTASAVHATDWDGDGDLDLVIGDIRGRVYLVVNERKPGEQGHAFGPERNLMAGNQLVQVSGDAGPSVADWDGDGLPDLLVGASDGSVWLYRNAGTRRQPELQKGRCLVPPGEIHYGADAPAEPRRGVRAKVCVADWNGDGQKDLLLGDLATQKPDLPEPTPEQKEEHGRIRAQLETTQRDWSALIQKLYGPERVTEREARKEIEARLKTLQDEMTSLRQKVPPEYEQHGWIWLFQRRPRESDQKQELR